MSLKPRRDKSSTSCVYVCYVPKGEEPKIQAPLSVQQWGRVGRKTTNKKQQKKLKKKKKNHIRVCLLNRSRVTSDKNAGIELNFSKYIKMFLSRRLQKSVSITCNFVPVS